jgi:hypothetical protein
MGNERAMSSLVQDFLNVTALVTDYHLEMFVETGCEDGVSMERLSALGLKLFSCDINAEKVETCRARFPWAQISHANSIDFLADVLPKIDRPALIWLDAHFGPPPYDTFPLEDEIALVATLMDPDVRDKSVILCDDISTVLQRSLTDFNINVNQGHATLAPYPLVDLLEFLPNHNWRVIAENTGVLSFTPKVGA